jgi:glycosyltransferase involved in cell wall biosynthesis
MSNYLDELETSVIQAIDNGELNDAISQIISFVESVMSDKRSLAKVFGSPILDNLCQKIGSIDFNNRSLTSQIKLTTNPDLVIYLATELYITGGHTAVIEDLIKSQPQKQHLILLTDLFCRGQSDSIKQRFSALPVNIEWAIEENYIDKLHWVQDKLVSYCPNQVFLFNHHQDAVAIAGVQQIMRSDFIFYHHADYLICLGLYLEYAKHIDGHAFCYENCKSLGVKNTVFIPLMVKDLGVRDVNVCFQNSKLRTCSSGHWSKYEALYCYSYLEIVPEILSVTGGSHIHIGELPTQAIESIQMNLSKREMNPDRFIYIPWVKSIWEAMEDQKIDLYINSFPIGGSKAVVEVMGSGTPIVGHNNYQSYLLSYAHTIYPEAFFWDKPDGLYSHINLLDRDTLIKQASFARIHYETYHTSKVFIECIAALKTGNNTIAPPLMKQYAGEELRAYLDDLEVSQSELRQTQSELRQTQSELRQTQSELDEANSTIAAIYTSKFWRLRSLWFKVKKFLKHSRKADISNHSPKTFAFISGCPGDSYRYRCQHQSEMLRYLGYSVEVYQPNLFPYKELLSNYKIVIAHRTIFTPEFEHFVVKAKQLDVKVIFDIDDLVFDLSYLNQIDAYRRANNSEKRLYENGVKLYGKSLSVCDYVTVSTDKLEQVVRSRFTDKKIVVLRNRISEEMEKCAKFPSEEGSSFNDYELKLAYFSGTKTHAKDFAECTSALQNILREFVHVKLMIVGHLDIPERLKEFTSQIEIVPFVDWRDLPKLYQKVAINLAPLELNNDFTEAKSELKYFEAALLSVPTIASDLGAFRIAIEDGVNGILCNNSLDWENALRKLITDSKSRKIMGERAFADINSRYLSRAAASKTIEILQDLLGEMPPLG